MKLGVNIDHIAVLREARFVNDPSPIDALLICKIAGADQITIHLREDRRHIYDKDVEQIINLSSLPVNLECSINDNIIDIVCQNKPYRATIVPENRQEITTEGGLDLEKNFKKIQSVIKRLKENDIKTSLFIDPNIKDVEISSELEADMIELHTGKYANIHLMLNSNLRYTKYSIKELEKPRSELEKLLIHEIDRLKIAAKMGKDMNLEIAAGHGLNYQNVSIFKEFKEITELNIGQSIIARSVFTGLEKAIKDMKELI